MKHQVLEDPSRVSLHNRKPTSLTLLVADRERLRQLDLNRVQARHVVDHDADLSAPPGRRVCHSVSVSMDAKEASAAAPASRRAGGASPHFFSSTRHSPHVVNALYAQRLTVTRKKVAGIDVLP